MILNQMDIAKNDAAVMRRIRKGWQAFGVNDPWWVVHDTPVRPMARYNSDSVICPAKKRIIMHAEAKFPTPPISAKNFFDTPNTGGAGDLCLP